MGIDPLSSATRAAKRNLLVASLLAITFKAFDVQIEKIPIPYSGLSITFDAGVFAFLVVVTLTYLIATFAAYYFIDISNFEITQHQKKSETVYLRQVGAFPETFQRKVCRRIEKAMPDPKNIRVILTDDVNQLMHSFEHKGARVRPSKERLSRAIQLIDLEAQSQHKNSAIDRFRHKELYETAEAILGKYLSRYWLQYDINRLLHFPRLFGVRSTYSLRNYVLDGLLPLASGLIGLAGMYNLISVRWLQYLTPQ